MTNPFRWSLVLLVPALLPSVGYSWYGPVCYPENITVMTLTLQSMLGESPGDVKVSFDDNSRIVVLDSVKPSQAVPGAHEIILRRTAESANGITGVIVTSPRSSVSYKFEIEFRKRASDCAGAIIEVASSSKPVRPGHSAPAKTKTILTKTEKQPASRLPEVSGKSGNSSVVQVGQSPGSPVQKPESSGQGLTDGSSAASAVQSTPGVPEESVPPPTEVSAEESPVEESSGLQNPE
jgi:hypothetical protein